MEVSYYMKALDFIFDGLYLSDFGCIICTFNGNSFETASVGSNITFNKSSIQNGKLQPLVSTKYDSTYEADFQICKKPESFNLKDEKYFSIEEQRDIMRWLNRNDFCDLFILSNEMESFCYNGSFNIEKITIGGNTVGFQLHFTSSRPFALDRKSVRSFNFPNRNMSIKIYDTSDEIGYRYVDMEVECKESGTLEIKNSLDKQCTKIENCTAGEKIIFHNMIIETSSVSHKQTIMNDFNFRFPKIINTFKKRENIYTFSLSCNGKISYQPIRKVGV